MNPWRCVTIIRWGQTGEISIRAARRLRPKEHSIRIEHQAPTAPARPAALLPLDRTRVPRGTVPLARHLLGKVLVRELDGARVCGRIVETEAYLEDDPACHAYRGMTRRNRTLFLDVGHAYVYLCYGTSYLLNVSSEGEGTGAGVLLRALEPLSGISSLRNGRHVRPLDLTRGPGRLTAALDVDLRHNGIDLFSPGPLWIGSDGTAVKTVGTSTRIGLTKGADAPLRFFLAGNRYLSGSRRQNAHAV